MAYTKTCNYCFIEKPLTDFRIRSDNGKHRNICKKCESVKHNEYISKHKELDKIAKQKYYNKYKDKISQKMKEYYISNKEEIKTRRKINREKNKEHLNELARIRCKKNRKQISAKEKERRKTDILFNFKKVIRQNIRMSFIKNNYIKKETTQKIIGCDYSFFLEHLLQTFKNIYGYEWDRKEKVHIDHIIPLCTAQNEDDVKKLCHYTNLQLLKEKDNLRKGSKLNYEIKEEFLCM